MQLAHVGGPRSTCRACVLGVARYFVAERALWTPVYFLERRQHALGGGQAACKPCRVAIAGACCSWSGLRRQLRHHAVWIEPLQRVPCLRAETRVTSQQYQ